MTHHSTGSRDPTPGSACASQHRPCVLTGLSISRWNTEPGAWYPSSSCAPGHPVDLGQGLHSKPEPEPLKECGSTEQGMLTFYHM